MSSIVATAKERDHIKACGDRWYRALARTTEAVRRDARLTGLDGIRKPLAFRAALKATGMESARYVCNVPPAGPQTDINHVVAEVFDRAVAFAREALDRGAA